MARTCHTAASLRPSRSSSLVEGARASLRLGVVLQRALPPVRPVATTASIRARLRASEVVELALCWVEGSKARTLDA